VTAPRRRLILPALEICVSDANLRASATLGGLLRALVDALDGDVDAAYRDDGLDYRARFTPVVRRLVDGPMSIKALATDLGLSHSALSQTVSELARRNWVVLTPGRDARIREVALTASARAHLPRLQAHWRAAALAAESLDADLGLSLEDVLRRALAALDARPFAGRLAEARTAAVRPEPGS
jgi:DNA-binding MarR family transcriptional regulator